jgi:transposase-like protein
MARHRTHNVAFKRQVAEEFIAGEALHARSKRHDISRQLIRIWVGKFEAGALDDDARRPTSCRNTKPKSQPWSGWSVARRWRSRC